MAAVANSGGQDDEPPSLGESHVYSKYLFADLREFGNLGKGGGGTLLVEICRQGSGRGELTGAVV